MPTAVVTPSRFRTLNARNFWERLPELFQANHIAAGCALSTTVDGVDKSFGYETYGAEVDFVWETAQKEPRRVATVVEAGRSWYMSAGFRRVDRVCYLVAKPGVELPDFKDFRVP